VTRPPPTPSHSSHFFFHPPPAHRHLPPFPTTTLFRSQRRKTAVTQPCIRFGPAGMGDSFAGMGYKNSLDIPAYTAQFGLDAFERSEEHTSELQSRFDLVCRLLLEKKKHR